MLNAKRMNVIPYGQIGCWNLATYKVRTQFFGYNYILITTHAVNHVSGAGTALEKCTVHNSKYTN